MTWSKGVKAQVEEAEKVEKRQVNRFKRGRIRRGIYRASLTSRYIKELLTIAVALILNEVSIVKLIELIPQKKVLLTSHTLLKSI